MFTEYILMEKHASRTTSVNIVQMMNCNKDKLNVTLNSFFDHSCTD